MADATTNINSHMQFTKPEAGVINPPYIPSAKISPPMMSDQVQEGYYPQGQYAQDPAALGLSPEMIHQAQVQAQAAAKKAKVIVGTIGAAIVGTVLMVIPKTRRYFRKAVLMARRKVDPKLTITGLEGTTGLKAYKDKILEIVTPDTKKTGKFIKQRLLQKRDIQFVKVRIQGSGTKEAKEALENIQVIAKEFKHYEGGSPVIKIKLSEKVKGKEAQIEEALMTGKPLTNDVLQEVEAVEMTINHKKKGFGLYYDIEPTNIKNAKGIDGKIKYYWNKLEKFFE